ncbi:MULTISPECIES: hypothetical protein [unclassified Olleya]|jgi:hypothetical protein|uniref:hypothetical protein n=1 Tax=unclassified Olleya TaxID=2615019 RepID=UPI00119DF785|nr:hypothetical protein [Olleya sp. Hel_I_94]TVZ46672.1 hypothetical protein JM82_1251 [Olleya sp. Hel_I_94]
MIQAFQIIYGILFFTLVFLLPIYRSYILRRKWKKALHQFDIKNNEIESIDLFNYKTNNNHIY